VGSILVLFSGIVTIGVAAYLYRAFREYKRVNDPLTSTFDLEAGETEFEIGQGENARLDEEGKPAERAALVTRTSDDYFLFNEEEELER
jgi:hypothetical protein